MANRRWKRDTSELRPPVTAQHLPSMGFLPLDLSHCCPHSRISRICQGSHLPAIMWKKHRKRAMRISSTLFFLQPSCALDKWTNSRAEDKPTSEKKLESYQELQWTLSHRIRNPQTPLTQEEVRSQGTAPQLPQNFSTTRRLWALQWARWPWKLFYHSKVLSRKNSRGF